MKKIGRNMIKNNDSCITISCNKCNYEWPSTVFNHITRQYGCKNCAGTIQYTYDGQPEKIGPVFDVFDP